jgi:hypothetical protein
MYDYGEPPMKETIGDLTAFARDDYNSEESSIIKDVDPYSTWDTWNTIRSVCQYNSRLSVGKTSSIKSYVFSSIYPKPPLYRELRLFGALFSSLKVPSHFLCGSVFEVHD